MEAAEHTYTLTIPTGAHLQCGTCYYGTDCFFITNNAALSTATAFAHSYPFLRPGTIFTISAKNFPIAEKLRLIFSMSGTSTPCRFIM